LFKNIKSRWGFVRKRDRRPKGGAWRVREYFDGIAERYSKIFSFGILNSIRRREMESVFRMLSPRPEESILDAGCGIGHYSIPLKALGAKVVGVDLSERMARMASAGGVDVIVADLGSTPLKGGFNKILCAGVLEFCEDPSAVIRNLSLNLKRGGHLVFLIPKRSPIGILYKLYHLSHGIRVRLFSMREFLDLLEGAGLRPISAEEPTWMSLVIKCAKM